MVEVMSRGCDRVVDQRSGFGGRESLRRLVLRRDGDAGIGIASPGVPGEPHHQERPDRNQQRGIAAYEPHKLGERAWRMQNALGNVNVNGHAATHGQRIRRREVHVGAIDLRRGLLVVRAIDAGERLRTQAPGSCRRELHIGGSLIDRHRPVIASDVPIELVVIVEESRGVRDRISNDDCFLSVFCARNEDLQLAIGTLAVRLIFQRVALGVGNAFNLQEQSVVGAVGAGIIDGNGAINSLVASVEDHGDALHHDDSALIVDGDGGMKVGDMPVASPGGSQGKGYKKEDDGKDFLHAIGVLCWIANS